jgi:hypothetical protein
VLQSTAPMQLKRFKVGSKMVIAASAPVLLNQKKQFCKIARFTDAPCTIYFYYAVQQIHTKPALPTAISLLSSLSLDKLTVQFLSHTVTILVTSRDTWLN